MSQDSCRINKTVVYVPAYMCTITARVTFLHFVAGVILIYLVSFES